MSFYHADPEKVSDPWQVNILNVHRSGLHKSGIDHMLDDTELTVVSGENSG